MTSLASISASVRLLLNDPLEKRFSADLLTSAIRDALQRIDLALPQTCATAVTIQAAGRSQPLTGVSGCRFLIKLVRTLPAAAAELVPETNFSYSFTGGVPTLHFHGEFLPQPGEVYQVHYAAGNTIEGLDGATATTLPAVCEPAFTAGAAASAYALRAALISESYGTRPEESARLLEGNRQWSERFEHMLAGLKTLQEFGYPPGFALDCWDGTRSHA